MKIIHLLEAAGRTQKSDMHQAHTGSPLEVASLDPDDGKGWEKRSLDALDCLSLELLPLVPKLCPKLATHHSIAPSA